MKPKSPWGHAHVKLKRLYDERVPEGMTQADFGKLYGVGNQSMVAQYLGGLRPLNYDVAAKFARGLNCTIEDICPEMANNLAMQVLPYLGKKLRRAALLVLALQLGGQPYDANASLHNQCGLDNGDKNLTNSSTYYTFSVLWKKLRSTVQNMVASLAKQSDRFVHLKTQPM